MLSLTKLFFDGEIKIFQDKDKLKQFMSTKYALQRIFKSSKTHGRE
jgi:hypothetical protein